jgi:hypothetical protein
MLPQYQFPIPYSQIPLFKDVYQSSLMPLVSWHIHYNLNDPSLTRSSLALFTHDISHIWVYPQQFNSHAWFRSAFSPNCPRSSFSRCLLSIKTFHKPRNLQSCKREHSAENEANKGTHPFYVVVRITASSINNFNACSIYQSCGKSYTNQLQSERSECAAMFPACCPEALDKHIR